MRQESLMFAESHTVVQEPLPQQEGVPAISSVRSAPVLQPQFHLLVPVNWYTACKRLLDMLLATVLLVLAAPLIALAALLVKLTSRGPVFYSQIRVGKGGRP